VPKKVVRRAISSNTAAQLVPMLEAVVNRGTAKIARMDGYTAAGKTGTAKKLVKGSYLGHSDYNTSFVGFVPSRTPRYTIVVLVDSPHKVSPYGGVVAAPIFRRISEAMMQYAGVPRTINPEPPVVVSRDETPGPEGPRKVSITDITEPGSVATTAGILPDLTGLSARDAVRVLVDLGLTPRVRGAGTVVAQDPPAGTPLPEEPTATLWLSRQPAAMASNPQP
jgi:cell division protein FtsI (penicillin-binding protein 3)